MPTITELNAAIADAMRARNQTTLDALRMLKTALTNKEVEKGRALEEAEAQQVVAALVKQRRDSIEQFTAAGRTELAAKEEAEILVLEAFQPPAATPAEIEAAVEAAVADTGPRAPRTWARS
jgi:uncharacterized protein